jgi:hypothetical protein
MANTESDGVPTLAPVRVGIICHGTCSPDAKLTKTVGRAIVHIQRRFRLPGGELPALVAQSALSDDVDRLIVRQVLKTPGSSLEVFLPVPTNEYLAKRDDPKSRAECNELIKVAKTVGVAPEAATPADADARAGRMVVNDCDVLIAVARAGRLRRRSAGESVAYAHGLRVPLVYIDSAPPYRLIEKMGSAGPATTGPSVVSASPGRNRGRRWLTEYENRFANLPIPTLIGWIAPPFVDADRAANRARRWYHGLTLAAIALPVVATLVVMLQVLYAANRPHLAAFEAGALLTVLVVVGWNHHRRYHDRWTAERFLAEWLRSAYFLAVCGARGPRPVSDGNSVRLRNASEREVRRSMLAARRSQPAVDVNSATLETTRDYLCEHWIGEQLRYYRPTSRRLTLTDKILRWISGGLFGVALGAATLHACSSAHPGHARDSFESALIAVSIGVPVVAAGFHGLRAQREYRRHAERYARIAERLLDLRKEMGHAGSLADVQRTALAVDRLTRDEHSDWFGAARLEDIEVNA